MASALHRPTWRAQVTHKFVSPRQGRPGSWVSWTITQPALLPAKAWLLPHLSNLFHHPYTCFSPPTLRLGSCVLGHLPLPVFSFSIPL